MKRRPLSPSHPTSLVPLRLVLILFSCWWLCSCESMAQTIRNVEMTRRQQPSAWTVPAGGSFGDLSRLVLTPMDMNENPPHEQQQDDKDDSSSIVPVSTRAIGLNFADVFTLAGYYKAANLVGGEQTKQAFSPGLEFAGLVMKDGHGFTKGDRVYGFTRFGAYADIVNVPANQLRRLPSNWTMEQGASFLVNALTAWYGLVAVAGMPNDNDTLPARTQPFVVVVHSASGGVGLWASEIAARRGALIVGIVGDESKLQTFYNRIRPLCSQAQCLVRRDDPADFSKGLASAIGRARSQYTGHAEPQWKDAKELVQMKWGCDVLMESYGGKYFKPCMELMNHGGSIATYGSTTYNGHGSGTRLPFLSLLFKYLRRPMVDPGELTSRNLRIGGFNLIFLTENTAELSQALEDCIACLSGSDNRAQDALASVTPPVVGSVYSFDTQAVDALVALRSGMTVGKVVLSNEHNPVQVVTC